MLAGLVDRQFVLAQFLVVVVRLASDVVQGAVFLGQFVAGLEELFYCEDVLALEFEDRLELGLEDF